MSKTLFKKFTYFILLLGFLLLPFFNSAVFAEDSAITDAQNKLNTAASTVGLAKNADPLAILATAIRYILGFVGTIFLILVIYAGFLWMTAGGNEQQITKGKNIMVWAVAGLAVIVLAYAISSFIAGTIQNIAVTS